MPQHTIRIFTVALLLVFFITPAFAGPYDVPAVISDSRQSVKCYDTSGAEIPCAGTGQDGDFSINPMSFTPLNGACGTNPVSYTVKIEEDAGYLTEFKIDNPVATGDLNNDGNTDIVYMNKSTQQIFVHLADSSKLDFNSAPTISLGSKPYSVAVGLLDGDRYADLAVGCTSKLIVFKGNGDGTFSGRTDYTTYNSKTPNSIAIGDLDNDSDNDIILSYLTNSVEDYIAVFYNNGNTLSTAFNSPQNQNIKLTVGTIYEAPGPQSVAIGKLNGDDYNDIAVACNSTVSNNGIVEGGITVFYNDGQSNPGQFGQKGCYPKIGTETGQMFRSINISDLKGDGDNYMDIAVIRQYPEIWVLWNNGLPSNYTTVKYKEKDRSIRSLLVADMNNDGCPDLVTTNSPIINISDIGILLNTGNFNILSETFMDETDVAYFPAGYNSVSAAVGNFDGMSWPFVAVANNCSSCNEVTVVSQRLPIEIPIISVIPTTRNLPSIAGMTTFSIGNSGTGTMNWTATESSSWLSITSDASGTDSGTITVSYTANTGVARTASVTVTADGATNSPVTLTVNQDTIQDELIVDFNAVGGLHRYNKKDNWIKLNTVDPGLMTSADIDNDGRYELAISFDKYGLYIWDETTNYTKINTVIPENIIRLNNGFAVDYGKAYGLYKYDKASGWKQLNTVDPGIMVAADIDNDGRDELAVTFVGYGLYIWDEAGGYTKIHTVIPEKVIRFNRGLAVDFGEALGLYRYNQSESWVKMSAVDPGLMTSADLDQDGMDELAVVFSGYGLYTWDETTGFKRINTVVPENMIRLNEGLAVDFGSAYGLYRYDKSDGWVQLNTVNPVNMTAADIDEDGTDELAVSFAGYGLYMWDRSYTKITETLPGGMISLANPVNDGDAIPDDWELKYFDNTAKDGTEDSDKDGLTDFEEYEVKTNPVLSDTDSDGMPDGWEADYGLDPLIDDASGDSDNDQIKNRVEYDAGTDPTDKTSYPKRFASEIVTDFGADGLQRYGAASWTGISRDNAENIITGDLDHDGKDELILTISGKGLYVWNEIDGCLRINTIVPEAMLLLNGDLAVDFGAAYGLWKYSTQTKWEKLRAGDATVMTAMDIDKDGTEELAVAFLGDGLYLWNESGGFTRINSIIPEGLIALNNDLIVDFSSTYGLWQYNSTVGWKKLNTLNPGLMITVNTDSDAREELAVSLAGDGLYVWDEFTGYKRISKIIPQNMIRLNNDIAVDFGSAYGLHRYNEEEGWIQLNTLDPGMMATIDIDDDGSKELVVGFSGHGLYIWDNPAGYTKVSDKVPERIVALTAKPHQDEVIVDFGSADGLERYDSASGWSSMSAVNPAISVAVDIDHDGKEELAVGFSGYGLYLWDKASGFTQINTVVPDRMIRLNDGLAVDFGSAYGLWKYDQTHKWIKLNALNPGRMAAVDIDHDGRDELAVIFSGNGLHIWDETVGFSKITSMVPQNMICLNHELTADFGEAYGLWKYDPVNKWMQLNTVDPVLMVAADTDQDGLDELAVSFAGYGLYIWDESKVYTKINTDAPQGMIRFNSGLAVDFGAASGLYSYSKNTWKRLNTLNPGVMTSADFDHDGINELAVSFVGYGLYLWDETGTYTKIRDIVPEEILAGDTVD